MSDEDLTTISIKKSTRDHLKTKGTKGESWDSLVNRILGELQIRSDGYYMVPLEMDGRPFGEADVLVEKGVPKRAIVNMATVKDKS